MSSSSCVVCGCEQFNLIDGFFYCALCNAQSQVQREVDLEDANILGNVGAVVMTKLGTNAAADGRKRGRQKRKMQHSEEQMASWAAVETDDYPRFLKRAGLRIATFTKLLSRYSNILIRDFNVAPTIRDHALGIFQRYLRHLNVAFCDEEINEENPYCPLVRNIDYEAQIKESQRQAQMEKERKLHSGKDILAQLTGNDLDEDLTATAIREEAIDRGDVQLVTEVRTKLSLEAFHRLLIIPLTHEILLVIVYLACLCAGARWILLSDVTRWYREGRFPLSFSQRFALIPVEPGVDDDRRHCHIVSIATPILSLFEMMRVVLAVCQMTDIPVQPISVDFDQIICRFCFNLNLPSVFVERVHALCAYLTPNCDLSQELSRRFGHFDSSVLLKYAMSPSSFNVDIGFENSENDSSRYLTGEKNVRHCMLPTPEVKAIAIILFALKLTFGLDDRREYGMTQRVANNVGSSRSFEFPLWIHQLRMRMDVWRGRTLKNVLEKRKHLSASYRGEETLKQTKLTELCDGRKVPFFLGKPCPSQDILFKGCAPNYVVNEAKEYAFYSTFADDIEPRPAEYIDREALIAPLRYQATRNDEWYNDLLEEEQRGAIGEQAALIDRYNTDLFFKSFKEYEMNYEECAKGGCCRKDSRRAEGRLETDHERLRWRHLFPCAGNYISYPHPVFTRHLFRYERQRSIICEPIAYAKALDLIMRTARIAFSESFTFLLEMLSLIIGEDQKVVYAFFLMVEMLYINCQTINELKELIEDRHELITCVQVCSLNCPPDQAEVKLRRVDEDVDSADYRYEILKFGDFIQCIARQHGTFILHNRHTEGNKRMGRKRRATTSMDAKLRGLHGLRRTIVSRRQRRLTTTSETQGNRRDESEGSPPSSLPKILYSEDEQGYSEREQQTNPQNTTSDQAVGSRSVNSECSATSGYTLQEEGTSSSYDLITQENSSSESNLVSGIERLIVDSAKRPARASCGRRQPENADSSSPTSTRRQLKRMKPLDVAPYSGKGFKSSIKLRTNHLKRVKERFVERLEFEFETAFTFALLKYW